MRGSHLTPEALARLERWAARESVECLYLLADAGNSVTVQLAEEAGFRLVDVRVTLERDLPAGGDEAAPGLPAPAAAVPAQQMSMAATVLAATATAAAAAAAAAAGAVTVRPATAADLPELRRIAAASHHDSRFYHDPRFDRARCDALYAAWIERSHRDPHGIVLVAPVAAAGVPAGYITAAIAPGGHGAIGSIGLFAVAAAARGRGIGQRLIGGAFDWLAGSGAGTVRVVTQGRNLGAQRMYQRLGMRTCALELWLHRWR